MMQYSGQRLRLLSFLKYPYSHQLDPKEDSADLKFKRGWKKTAIILCVVASIFALIASTLGFYAFQQQLLRKHHSMNGVKVANNIENFESDTQGETEDKSDTYYR